VVQMSREIPLRALEATLADAQERLIDSVCGPRWALARGLPAPFCCPRCAVAEDFVRKGRRTRKRKLCTAAGTVELVLWHVGCRDCGRVFAPLLEMLGLSGKRRTDRLTVDLAELSTQVSFVRAGQLSRQLASTTATAGQAHNAVADMGALLPGPEGTLGPGHPSPDVVRLDGIRLPLLGPEPPLIGRNRRHPTHRDLTVGVHGELDLFTVDQMQRVT